MRTVKSSPYLPGVRILIMVFQGISLTVSEAGSSCPKAPADRVHRAQFGGIGSEGGK